MSQFSDETHTSKESAIIPVSPETDALVERDMPDAEESLKLETKALVEAIKKRAQTEIQAAQDLSRETYLTAVRQAKEAVEQTQLINPEQIEHSAELLIQDAQKNWDAVVNEISTLGDRLAEAAQLAWETLTQPKSSDSGT